MKNLLLTLLTLSAFSLGFTLGHICCESCHCPAQRGCSCDDCKCCPGHCHDHDCCQKPCPCPLPPKPCCDH